MLFYFKISSKDDQTLKRFLLFLSKLNVLPILLKHFAKQKKRKHITILKSPHINKTAQEQFEFRYYSKEFVIDSRKALTFLLIVKKIKSLSFPGVKLEIRGLFNSEKKSRSFLNQANPDKIILNQHQVFQKRYLQSFDCYGELWLINNFFK